MLTTLLFIAIIISFKTFSKGFMKLNTRFGPFSKSKLLARVTSTTYYDDDEPNDKQKKIYNFNYEFCSDLDLNFNNHDPEQIILPNNEKYVVYNVDDTLYTLIWFDCKECIDLLRDIKNDCKKILYINGTYYFFDENDETNTPLFYKNSELIATDLFGIYEELFYNKIFE